MSLTIGTCGEYLTCFDLYNQGYPSQIMMGQLQYDVVMQNKSDLIKIQVKTSNFTESGSYRFVIKRHTQKKILGIYEYVDMFAFAVPDLKKVAYMTFKEITQEYKVTIPPDKFDHLSITRALDVYYGTDNIQR